MATVTTRIAGQVAEDQAQRFLEKQGLVLVARNYQPSGRAMADLDLVMTQKDGTLVFIEVKQRSRLDFGGAAHSISIAKQRRLIKAAQYFLMRLHFVPVCRFDVVLFEAQAEPVWIKGAFGIVDNG